MSSIVKNTAEIVWTHNVDGLKDKYCVFHLKGGSCVCGWVDSIGVTSMIICDRYNCNARTLLTTELDPDMHYTQYELATGIMSEGPNSDSFMQYWLLSDKVTYEFDTESVLYKAFISGNHIAVFHNKMNRDMVLYFIGFCDDDSIQVRFCEDNTIHKYSAEEFDKTFSDIGLFAPADKQTSDDCSELEEAKRLLRLAVEDFDVLGEVKFSPKPGAHPKRREYIRILDLLDHRWRYADEALKLLKEGR